LWRDWAGLVVAGLMILGRCHSFEEPCGSIRNLMATGCDPSGDPLAAAADLAERLSVPADQAQAWVCIACAYVRIGQIDAALDIADRVVPAARPALQTLRRVLQPVLDGYWAVVDHLARQPASWTGTEEQLLRDVRTSWERSYLLGGYAGIESGSQAIFKNALEVLRRAGYLQESPGERPASGRGGRGSRVWGLVAEPAAGPSLSRLRERLAGQR